MPPILAQLDKVDPQFLWQFLLVIAGLSVVADKIVGWVRSGKKATHTVEPQPLEVSLTKKVMTPEECITKHAALDSRVDRCEKAIDQIRAELRHDREVLDKADEQRASRIHQHIEKIEADMNEKVQNLPNQIIALLRNAGAIKDK